MLAKKNYDKLVKRILKFNKKYLKDKNYEDIINIKGTPYILFVSSYPNTLSCVSEDILKELECINIIRTLKECKFERTDKWTEKVVNAFIYEVITLYTYVQDATIIESEEVNISERYNVPINRLKTQVALFLTNLKSGKDKFNILHYFSIYNIIKWKYRDLEKLQQDIENQKIDDEDLKYLRELNIIE